ncbi:hypothetical protein CGMCC3_g7241 [Colletotrichum fructicola]|nr:uncharacterized protein CGMCC3_g7241 [Colletotrichum fructicola]KAE9576729.1 hypothetical protein CGMCC3_g7241 [Colletotrichum fructicola]
MRASSSGSAEPVGSVLPAMRATTHLKGSKP